MPKNKLMNLRMNSFASFDDAMDMCELLSRETGDEYTVMPDNHLGFTANRIQSSIKKSNKKGEIESEFNARELRQAWRGFITNYFEIFLGLLLIMNPYRVMGWVFYCLSIETLPEWLNLKGVGDLLGLGGVLLILYGLRFIYSYFAEKLYIDEDGIILKKGILAQSQVQIRFSDIKTIGVQQGILDRLMGIGTVHLDSAGTNGTVDIEFKNTIDPIRMRRNIQILIDNHIKFHG
ncbi:MAG: PH domain-containing protein [Methylicorpusculum sp.]|jgi:membrane protein YdbS with pleckstrin-like domain|uniref:PH domain-containing protein n=1 Tax=Methylococcaceae TaxID=403 RepID=UPI0005699B2F|nr:MULTISPECIES: PH domain-containing protein [Methylococcaceae]MCD2451931.1 PH domain-containing protein [Methylicorpusculum oleiharenae]MDP2202746.1 PH domain-containing protein [Methylicorpusculum sp.]